MKQRKLGIDKTNLVDEWRSNGRISTDKIVGIFMPLGETEGHIVDTSIFKQKLQEQIEEYDILMKEDQEEFGVINEDELNSDACLTKKDIEKFLEELVEIINENGWIICNSEVRNFTDLMDATLGRNDISMQNIVRNALEAQITSQEFENAQKIQEDRSQEQDNKDIEGQVVE